MYSMLKPIFKSLKRFSLRSPRLEYHSIVATAFAGDGVTAIERVILEQVLVAGTSLDDQSERFVGLAHALD